MLPPTVEVLRKLEADLELDGSKVAKVGELLEDLEVDIWCLHTEMVSKVVFGD